MKKYFISIAILTLLGTGFLLPRGPNSEKKVIFQIKKGEGLGKISANLEKNKLVWWGPFFSLYAVVSGSAGKLQAGFYSLDSGMNIARIAKKFSEGEIAKETITVPEGFTAKQIHAKLKNVTTPDLVALQDHEGYLFPDTYEISYGMAVEDVIKIMRDNFDLKTVNLKITAEVIIMASLIEKEVRTKDDKELVSGVLWKRLRAGVPLQVDATINYITGNQAVRVSKEETKIDSPYNTYLGKGLPAGPISNPGLESIRAALYPENSAYWYYLSTPEGKTIFSRTLDEHNYAKAKYLK